MCADVDKLKLTAQVVSSVGFCAEAAMAIYESEKKRAPDNKQLEILKEWAESGGGHLPVMWGSAWACDYPWLLNQIVEQPELRDQLTFVVESLQLKPYDHPDNDRFHQLALRIAEYKRAGGGRIHLFLKNNSSFIAETLDA